MPPKKRKGKKGKGKRKGKGKKKKQLLAPEPPPLHLLTELYKKLDDATIELYEMRVAMRRKRLETWYMMMQISEAKLNNRIFKEYIQGKMNDLQEAIDRFLKLIQNEKDEIAAAIKKICDEYERQKQEFLDKSAKIEEDLAAVELLLLEFEPMMGELARLLARLEQLKKEIEAAELDADLKVRHLTNQFLMERGRLHNHLEEQLCELIKHCRSYIMPILWNFMQKLIARNICARWKLARVDEKNIALAEKREELIRQRKLLTLEKPYWGIDWALYKMSEDTAAHKRGKTHIPGGHEEKSSAEIRSLMIGKTDEEVAEFTIRGGTATLRSASTGTLLGQDFNKFLIQRLTAANAAQARAEKTQKKQKKKFFEVAMESAADDRRKTMAAINHPSMFFDDDYDDQDYFDQDDQDQWYDVPDEPEAGDEVEDASFWIEATEEEEEETVAVVKSDSSDLSSKTSSRI